MSTNVSDHRLSEILKDERQQAEQRRAEESASYQAEQNDEKAALRAAISKRKSEMRQAINQAIAEGRIPGRPSDYTISLPTFRGYGRRGPEAGHERIRTKLFPALDLRTMSYDDYPHHAALEAIEREVGFYVEGAG